jgi:chromate reductase, NAD(P)H dehydrogenase (quinone)
MHILAISGSLRRASTNTALLQAVAARADANLRVTVWSGLADIPPFNPDHEGPLTPDPVLAFAQSITNADGIIISCPEYVHALPGAFKNAIDWLVSRTEITGKPIALLHASHGGDDVLADLRRVLETVSDRFASDIFAQFTLRGLSPDAIAQKMALPDQAAKLDSFLQDFIGFIGRADESPQPGKTA